MVEASDRLHIYVDGDLAATQYQETVGEELLISGQTEKDTLALDILVENLGRVNYGFKLNNPTQSKGIRGGVMQDIHFHQGYQHYPLTFSQEQLAKIDYTAGKNPLQPSFYQVTFELEQLADTYIDCRGYGKGFVVVNGHHLGRYWEIGPIHSLYCPKEFLQQGQNEVVIFETEELKLST